MNFGPFTYLVTTLIFTGVAILIEWTYSFRRLKRHLKVILTVVITGVVLALIGEPVALFLGAWAYNQDRTLNAFIFGSAIETVLYAILVSIAVASATLVWSDWEDSKLPLVRTTFSKVYSKLRDFITPSQKRLDHE